MNEYIINHPQLQSIYQRSGAVMIWLLCWLLWGYFLTPLITLCAWLLDSNSFSNEIRWFGGSKSLLELLQIYVNTLLLLAVLWIVWVVYHYLRSKAITPVSLRTVTDAELCRFYRVNEADLQSARQAQVVTVYFDETAQITRLEAEPPQSGAVLSASEPKS